ncbi:hypothetical protein L484_028013 [Morus notabilis]|uniref:Uncharacterized protein n=1 Tax=Morus notabilis TaxID=981085 RepID=W9SIA3_9ROSA|nr:hypothetical protein L484_028013 [Morus notabilis]
MHKPVVRKKSLEQLLKDDRRRANPTRKRTTDRQQIDPPMIHRRSTNERANPSALTEDSRQ